MKTTFSRITHLAAMLVAAAAAHGENAPSAGWQAVAGDQWRPVDQSDMRIEPGSALDFSSMIEPGPAGRHGYAFVNREGQLAFPDHPEKTLRFFCCAQVMVTFPHSSNEDIEAYADEVVRGGYNLFRPHYLDIFLTRGVEKDLEFNPVRLDIWDRLSAALKKRGVHFYFDASTSELLFSRYANWDPGHETAPPWSLAMYWDPAAREHWKTGVTQLLSHVNPYTGVALKDEPQVAILQCRNESGLGFKTFFFLKKDDQSNRIVTANFRTWLKNKYQTVEALRRAWTDPNAQGGPKEYLPAGRTFETLSLPEQYAYGPDTLDLYRFYIESERELFSWEKSVIESLGVKSIILDYNNMHNIYSHLVRDMMPVTDGHGYHSHPTNYTHPGSKVVLESAAQTTVVDFIPMASAHQCGRPVLCSEWGEPFWQQWRGPEGGMIMPAYAALQGWQMLTQSHGPVLLRSNVPIRPFGIAPDPATRAAERMATFLYGRGDIQRSPHLIQATLDAPSIIQHGKPSPAFSMPETLTRLGLLAGFGTYVKGMPDSAPRGSFKADIEFIPTGGGRIVTTEGVQSVEIDSSAANQTAVAQEINALRRAGILSAANRTDPDKGLYESDTGQILLDSHNNQIQIRTERSQGASLHPACPAADLPNLRARTRGEKMGVFLASLDANPLSTSRRMLLIVATDALNSGMTFTNEDRTNLVDNGHLPVLVKTGTLDVTIINANAERLKLRALNLRGQPQAELPLDKNTPGQASASIDTATIPGEPAVYFELTVQ